MTSSMTRGLEIQPCCIHVEDGGAEEVLLGLGARHVREHQRELACKGEGRCKATWKREFKLPCREAAPPAHASAATHSDQATSPGSFRVGLCLVWGPGTFESISLNLPANVTRV